MIAGLQVVFGPKIGLYIGPNFLKNRANTPFLLKILYEIHTYLCDNYKDAYQ